MAGIGNLLINTNDADVPVAHMPVARDAVEYNMNHKKRGLALVFIHEHFDQQHVPRRPGADKDFEGVKGAFARLRFDVSAHWDCTINEIVEHSKEAAGRDHTDNDCIAIVVSSHGDGGGYLHARNGTYCLDRIFQMFTADQCPTLAGKPKLFFIQACRGGKFDDGILLQKKRIDTDGVPTYCDMSYRIPLHADFLISYSTVTDFVSWHNASKGSWFIQHLVKELNDNGTFYDILTLLTFVNQSMATGFESWCPDKPEKDCKKQMPCFTSMLTRILRFSNKS